jgi:CHAT domain-containing protein
MAIQRMTDMISDFLRDACHSDPLSPLLPPPQEFAIVLKIVPLLTKALNHYEHGEYDPADTAVRDALALYDGATDGRESAYRTVLQYNLMMIYRESGDEGRKAEPLLKQILATRERTLGAASPLLGRVLRSLAWFALIRHDYNLADFYYRRALTNYEQEPQCWAPAIAMTLIYHALVSRFKGEYQEAISALERALALSERIAATRGFGRDKMVVATILTHLAEMSLLTEATDQAVTYQLRADALRDADLVASTGLIPEDYLTSAIYKAQLTQQTEFTVSLHTQYARTDPRAFELALTAIIRRKGAELDFAVGNLHALREQSALEIKHTLQELSEKRATLASLRIAAHNQINLGKGWEKNIQQMVEHERALAHQLSNYARALHLDQPRLATLPEVQTHLPENATLVEFFRYRPFRLHPRSWEPARYVAYVLGRWRVLGWVDLGSAEGIEQRIEALLETLRDKTSSKAMAQLRAQELDRMLIGPIEPFLSDGIVLLAPDSALNLVPFAALMDKTATYRIKRFTFVYLTSGRDLLRLNNRNMSTGHNVVIGYPDYNLNGQNVTRDNWPVLPWTLSETATVGKLLHVEPLMRGKATEEYFKSLQRPRLLHVATHGFFWPSKKKLEAQDPDYDARPTLDFWGPPWDLAPQLRHSLVLDSPLLNTGIILAGANKPISGKEDGYVTALELAGMDFRGTQLVVLSACETGLGEIRIGDGVYGLRRSLMLSGAQSGIVSLWQVSDRATSDLMNDYYQYLIRGTARAESLRKVQLRFLTDPKDPQRQHPYYWAGFVHLGHWGPLKLGP